MQDDNHHEPKRDVQAKRGSKFSTSTPTSNKKVRKIAIGLNFIENFYAEIPNIIQIFFDKYVFKSKISTFLTTCPYKEGYDYLLAVIKHFPEFNLFDYICDDQSPPSDPVQIFKKKKFYTARNDLFFNLLLYSNLNKENSNTMDKQVDNFIKVNNENLTSLDYEVDYFFLCILGYRDKAKSLLIKYNEYFKTFLKYFKDMDIIGFLMKLTVDKKPIDMTIDEIVVIRKIINSTILRHNYSGIIFLLTKENIFLLMVEGRIWKSIITEFNKDECLEIYINYCFIMKQYLSYYKKTDELKDVKKRLYFHSLSYEYEAKIKELRDEEDKVIEKEILTKDLLEFEALVRQKDAIIQEREELEKDISLPAFIEFVDLLNIIFMFNKKEVALAILYSDRTEIIPTLEIFEICLNYDEDLAM
jgi:hypothetical protein